MTPPKAADELVKEFGRVDILIANLAYPHKYAPVHEKSDADMELAMNVAYQCMAQLALPSSAT